MSNQLFDDLGAAASEIFFCLDKATQQLTYLSPAFTALTSAATETAMANPATLLDYVHADDLDYLKAQLAAFDTRGELRTEFRLNLTHSKQLHVKLIAYSLPAHANLVAGWLSDITVDKDNLLYAEKINARKNSLLEVLSHDLKEPVGMINLMASAIGQDPAVIGNEMLKSYVKTIKDLCDANITLIRSLVQQEFLEARDVGLRLERADLVWAVKDVMQQYLVASPLLKKTFVFEHTIPQLHVLMDTLKLIQVVNNLVSNAIKFTEDGGIITVTVADKGSQVRITVQDNGIGIPAELQPSLFEPHSRASRPGLAGEPGVGMGLSIIRTIVRLHNGRVWLESEEGQGTTVYVELPKQPDV